MIKKYFTISIIKEARIDENRTPFVPNQIQTLISNFPDLKILVQPSKNRCFKDKDYFKAGAKIEEDISQSDIIFGIKEVEISKLIENKTYLFFSHTSKIRNDNSQVAQDAAIIYKKKLLREVVSNKEGSGNKAEVPGYFVAGKTGTAIKNKYHRYEKNKNLTSFVGFFPSYNPEFLIFIMVDEPKPIKETNNYVTGGWVAAPTVKKIISEMAPKLGIIPKEKFKENLQKHVSLKNN